MTNILSTPEQLRQQIKDVVVICQTVAEMIKDAGPDGIPSGYLYSALGSFGCTINSYNNILKLLKDAGVVRESGFVLYYIHPAGETK